MESGFADHTLWEKEQEAIAKARSAHPEQFEATKQSPTDTLHRIGIFRKTTQLPQGYLKYSPLDFIVEEITPTGQVIAAGDDAPLASCPEGSGTVYADLVKISISTLDAVQRIANALHVPQEKIGYAGIKDAVALTAQRISIRGVEKDTVTALSIPGLVLRNVVEGKGILNIGDLSGNRFTILIRTDTLPEEELFRARIATIEQGGIVNYYGPQRFGTPRLISHILGKHLWAGDIPGLIRDQLTGESPFELPYIAELRRDAASQFLDWEKMDTILAELPYTFRFERHVLAALKTIPQGQTLIPVVNAIGQQADFWTRSYASYMVNLTLSNAEESHVALPDSIPLPLSFSREAQTFYREYLRRDGTENFIQNLRQFPFIHIGKNPTFSPRMRPIIHSFACTPLGLVISFDLPKAAYATTMLMSLFDLTEELPFPDWIKKDNIDSKEILGTGSLRGTRELFKKIVGELIQRTSV